MLKTSMNGTAEIDVPDTIPTILLPVSEKDTTLETYLRTGWQIVGKMSMTNPDTVTCVNDYVVLQPVPEMASRQLPHWQ